MVVFVTSIITCNPTSKTKELQNNLLTQEVSNALPISLVGGLPTFGLVPLES